MQLVRMQMLEITRFCYSNSPRAVFRLLFSLVVCRCLIQTWSWLGFN